MSNVERGARLVWLRHGVVEVARFAEVAGDPFVVVEPVGWNGDAGWIARRATDEQLRPLASRAICERWLAELRADAGPRTPGQSSTRRSVLELSVEFGTSEQQVAALAELYAGPAGPDAGWLDLVDRLERIVVVEIACVLGRDLETLRAELRARLRPRSGAAEGADPPELPRRGDPFAVFPVGGELHVTDLDSTSVRVPAVRDLWHAAWQDDRTWVAIAASYRDRLPLAREGAHEARVIARSEGNVYPFAVLDGAALPNRMLEEMLFACLAHDVLGVGAATFNRDPHAVTAYCDGDVCFAVAVHIVEDDDDDDDDISALDDPALQFVRRGTHLLQLRRGVVYVEDIRWDPVDYMAVFTRDIDGMELTRHREHGIANVLRPLVDRATAEQALARLARPTVRRLPGDAAARDQRYRDFIEHGTFDEQVEALGLVYAEPHRPTPAELDTIERMERLVVGEIAAVLGRRFADLASELRARSARFALDAPAASDAPAAPAGGVALPEAFRWIATFGVEHTLQLTDLTNNTISLEAVPGPWHAAWHGTAILAFAEHVRPELPLAAASRTLTIDGPRDFPLALLDARALQSSVVSNALIEGRELDVLGRGVAWLPTTEPVEVQIWERDGVCVAVQMS